MKTVFGMGIVIAVFFLLPAAGATQPSRTVVKISLYPWTAYYIQAIKQATDNHAPPTLRFPQIYLYDPQGNPVAFVQSPQKLKEILEQIPIYTPRENVANHPLSLAMQLRLLRGNGARGLSTPPSGKWTVLFYGLADSAAVEKLVQVLKATPQNTAKKLYVIRVNFHRKSHPTNKDTPRN